jgi:isoquinoline 1-oxidoreductase beta subunit
MQRRDFLRAGAGLALGFVYARNGAGATSPLQPNAWLRILPDGNVTILIEKTDLGQGIWTGIAMLVAEELETDWETIRLEAAPADRNVFKDLVTGGSGGMIGSWDSLRRAGAQGREMLIAAAALTWHVFPAECRAERGTVVHPASGRRLTYGALVETAATLPVPDVSPASLKQPHEYRILGTSVPRKDIPPKTDGSAVFGIDIRVPGMLYAVVARCPTFGGKPASYDAAAAKAISGVLQIFEIEPLPRLENTAGGVAVVADSTWAAMEGRKALNVRWDLGPNAAESSETLRKQAQSQLEVPPTYISLERGSPVNVLASAQKVIRATYELPFQPHATMEPMNCTVDVRADRMEVWTGTQCPLEVQDRLSKLAKQPVSALTIHNCWSGGGFGRRFQWDYPAEAWQISKAAGHPVKLTWTREDDFGHDFYRPLSFHGMAAALDARGQLAVWSHRIVSTSIRQVFDSAEQLTSPQRVAGQELGCASMPYAVPNMRVDFAPLTSCVPRAWWRSVSESFNVFAVECFIDEIAAAAAQDPLQFRLDHLRAAEKDPNHTWHERPSLLPRLRRVLEVAADRAGWSKPLPTGTGRGIAACYSCGSFVAYVATVSNESNGSIRVRKVDAVVDCGFAVNPDSVKAMIEGGANFGLAAALAGEITIANGAVQQTNFDTYRTLRMPEAPDISIEIINSHEDLGGLGEAGVPPIAPAVANAIFAATGKRIRKLPIMPGVAPSRG